MYADDSLCSFGLTKKSLQKQGLRLAVERHDLYGVRLTGMRDGF